MRLCTLCHPHKSFTNKGWYTHMARKHKTKPCPHPFCPEILTEAQVLEHLEKEHPEWKMADGRFVFEVLSEVCPKDIS